MSHTPFRRDAFPWRGLSALIVAGTVVLVACGSGGGRAPGASSSPATSSRPFAAYRQCLEQHGREPAHAQRHP
jgi:hypothetical protein